MAGQPAAFGIAEPAGKDRGQHQQVGLQRGLDAIAHRVADHAGAAQQREQPEGGARPLAAAQHPEQCGTQWQQADEHDGVTAPRPGLAQQQQQAKAKHCGDGGACGGDEPGVQFKHRQAGGRQRAGEDHHTDEAIDPTAR
ncbi:hypothetical protein G6F59_015625 [Rhizopus arrhizus]|nr:hypothetical protein G6F59_015625 [Rhizopus arrhizus]